MDDQHVDSQFGYWKLLFLPVAGYLFVFLLIVMDELVLKTNWISQHIDPGDRYGDFVRTIYSPLIYLVKQLL